MPLVWVKLLIFGHYNFDLQKDIAFKFLFGNKI